MAWPDDPAAASENISAAGLNRLPSRLMEHYVASPTTQLRLENIPNHFTHLRVVAMARCDLDGSAANGMMLRLNDETGSIYYRQYLAVNTTTAASSELLGATSAQVAYMTAASASSELWGVADFWLFDYAGSSRKCWISQSIHFEADTTGHAGIWSGFASLTDPIDTITLHPNTTSNVIAGSRMTLYGVP